MGKDRIVKLLDRLLQDVDKIDTDSLHDGLYNGKGGLALLQLLEYNVLCNRDFPEKSVRILESLISSFNLMPKGFLFGKTGFCFILGKLSSLGIIERPEELMAFSYSAVNEESSYFFNSPIQVDLSQPLYPFGICMMSVLDDKDDAGHYCWEEQIIFRLCDCEKFLTSSYPTFYTPDKLSAGILHSVFAFANLAHSKKIYPHKAQEIMNILNSFPEDNFAKDSFINEYYYFKRNIGL